MRTAPLALAALLLAGAVLAQTPDGRQLPPPDYSRVKLREIFSTTLGSDSGPARSPSA